MDTDETAIRSLVDDRVAAMERGDAAAIVAQYVDRPVVFSLAPPLVQPTDDGTRALASLQAWFDEKGGRVGSGVRDVRVELGGDVAFVSALERMGDPGGRWELWFRLTLGLRRVDGTWRIVHEHTSTPFHMDGSYRAATELTP